jgi:hypothetical protein
MSDQLKLSIDRRARKYVKAALNPFLCIFRPGNVAMFHVGRVGSTVLGSMLRQDRRIHWPGEVFEREHMRYTKAVKAGGYTRLKDPLKILRTEMRAAGHRTFGFETKFLDEHHLKVIGLDLESYIDALSRLGFDRYVVLTRRNILRRLVSGIVLRETGRAHVLATQAHERRRFHLDLNGIPLGARSFDVVDAIQMIEEGHERLSRALAGKKVCELNYEDHISDDPFVAYRRLMTFMGLEPGQPTIAFRKTNPDPLSETIENYDELLAALETTPYKWMLTG